MMLKKVIKSSKLIFHSKILEDFVAKLAGLLKAELENIDF